LKLDASHELQTALAEQYENSANFLPGEIYYKIRHYREDKLAEARWLAGLSRPQQDNVKQFLKHDSLPAAFDKLLDFGGQWFGFRASMLPDIIAMKRDEVS
jgi:uncharacterized protein YcaQ